MHCIGVGVATCTGVGVEVSVLGRVRGQRARPQILSGGSGKDPVSELLGPWADDQGWD